MNNKNMVEIVMDDMNKKTDAALKKQEKLDKIFMNTADQFATLSHCVSHQVGSVIVKDDRIIATGYNGTPMGMVNCDQIFVEYKPEEYREAHTEWSNANEIHAEMNALIFCAKNGIKIENATIYSTVQPCQHCLKNLIQVGIKRIVYKIPYDKAVHSIFLTKHMQKNNIIIEQIKE